VLIEVLLQLQIYFELRTGTQVQISNRHLKKELDTELKKRTPENSKQLGILKPWFGGKAPFYWNEGPSSPTSAQEGANQEGGNPLPKPTGSSLEHSVLVRIVNNYQLWLLYGPVDAPSPHFYL